MKYCDCVVVEKVRRNDGLAIKVFSCSYNISFYSILVSAR